MSTLTELLEKLPEDERHTVSAEYADWYNQALKDYSKDFDIGETGQIREFQSANEVVRFFQTAIEWWENRKPKKSNTFSPADSIRIWTCNGQIKALKIKYAATGIPMERLESDSFEEPVEPDDD